MISFHICRRSSIRHALPALSLMLALFAGPAQAERPMVVDDAGAMAKGDAKIEGGWSRDDEVRGWDLALGYGPADGIELELAFARLRDRSTAPQTKFEITAAAAKWVPLQSDVGLSAGLKAEIGSDREDDQLGTVVKPKTHALTGLATWAFASGQRVHLNLGRAWEKVEDVSEGLNNWGLGFEQPVSDTVTLTLETFGDEHARPDRQVGVRWTVAEGIKLSAAAGRGNDRSFAQAGAAWEF